MRSRGPKPIRSFALALALAACGDRGVTIEVEPDSPATKGKKILEEAVGIETSAGDLAWILEPTCPIPCEETVTFGTAEDDQAEIPIYVYRGKTRQTADARSLGVFEIGGFPPAPGGEHEVSVTFRATEDGISLSVVSPTGLPVTLARVQEEGDGSGPTVE